MSFVPIEFELKNSFKVHIENENFSIFTSLHVYVYLIAEHARSLDFCPVEIVKQWVFRYKGKEFLLELQIYALTFFLGGGRCILIYPCPSVHLSVCT